MKITINTIIAIFTVVLAMVSCSSEENDVISTAAGKDANTEVVEFSVTQENDVTSKTVLGEDNFVNWSTGDIVAVCDNGIIQAQKWHRLPVANPNGTTCRIKGTVNSGSTKFLAVYPSSVIDDNNTTFSIVNKKIGKITIPSTQKATANTFDPSAAVLVAYSDDGKTLSFKNVCSYIKVTIPTNCQYSKLKISAFDGSGNQIYLTGFADIILGTDNIPTTTKFSSATADQMTVTLVPSSGAVIASGTYYVAVVPSSAVASITIECADKTVTTPSVTTPGTVTIGGVQWATFNLGASNVKEIGDYYAWGATAPFYTSISKTSAKSASLGTHKFVRNQILNLGNIKVGTNWYTTEKTYDPSLTNYSAETYKTKVNPDNMPLSTFLTSAIVESKDASYFTNAANDAATTKLGSGWRLPTYADFCKLTTACGTTVTKNPSSIDAKGVYYLSKGNTFAGYEGVAGILFCDGTNKLFFPASGYVDGTTTITATGNSYFWLSKMDSTSPSAVKVGETQNPAQGGLGHEYYGLPIRPVKTN